MAFLESLEEPGSANDPAPLLDPTLTIHLGGRTARLGNDNAKGGHDITLERSGATVGREKRQIALGRREVLPKARLQYRKVLEEDVKGHAG